MANLARRRFFQGQRKTANQLLPWIKSANDFYDNCTRCNACIDSCETKIISLGDGGFPTIDFSRGECTFCYQCAQSCPERLFSARSENPWQQVIEIEQSCLAFNKVDCRSCEDACESIAIKFKPTLGGPAKPIINTDLCSGCGACIKPCPTQSIKIQTGANSGN